MVRRREVAGLVAVGEMGRDNGQVAVGEMEEGYQKDGRGELAEVAK